MRVYPGITDIAVCTQTIWPGLLALNASEEAATSPLDEGKLRHLVDHAFAALCISKAKGFLIAFDERAPYDSPNYLWFCKRFSRFIYVDRIVIAAEARGQGLARTLYHELFSRARAAKHERVVCEVNIAPPNPQSDAFHDRLGFVEIGQARLPAAGKVVRYLECRL